MFMNRDIGQGQVIPGQGINLWAESEGQARYFSQVPGSKGSARAYKYFLLNTAKDKRKKVHGHPETSLNPVLLLWAADSCLNETFGLLCETLPVLVKRPWRYSKRRLRWVLKVLDILEPNETWSQRDHKISQNWGEMAIERLWKRVSEIQQQYNTGVVSVQEPAPPHPFTQSDIITLWKQKDFISQGQKHVHWHFQ